jgi:hypothetical protein
MTSKNPLTENPHRFREAAAGVLESLVPDFVKEDMQVSNWVNSLPAYVGGDVGVYKGELILALSGLAKTAAVGKADLMAKRLASTSPKVEAPPPPPQPRPASASVEMEPEKPSAGTPVPPSETGSGSRPTAPPRPQPVLPAKAMKEGSADDQTQDRKIKAALEATALWPKESGENKMATQNAATRRAIERLVSEGVEAAESKASRLVRTDPGLWEKYRVHAQTLRGYLDKVVSDRSPARSRAQAVPVSHRSTLH